MHSDGTNVVGMRLEARDFLRCIVIVYADLKVIRTAYDPILAGNKSPRTNRHICELERFDNCFGGKRPDVDMSTV